MKKLLHWYRIKDLEFRIHGLENLMAFASNPYMEGDLIMKISRLKSELFEAKK